MRFVLAFSLAIAPCAVAVAQTADTTTIEPGKIENRIQKPAARPAQAPTPAVPQLPQPDLRPDGADIRFVLAGVEITGNTVYPISDFAPMYETFLAKEIKTSEVQALVKMITEKYRDDGYFLAAAIADPQDLALGILRIRINEGIIRRVSFKGDLGRRAERLKRFAAKIKASMPARLDRLERYMMLIGDLPGATIDGALKPIDKDKGEFELIFTVGHKIADGYTSVDNRGTRAVGRYQALLSGNLNTGLSDSERTGLTVFTIPRSPKELVYGELTHEQHFGTEGLRAWISASHSEVDVGGVFSESDLGSRSTRVILGGGYPLIRSRDHNLSVTGKIEFANQRQNQDDVRDFDDRLRLLRLGANYRLNDDLGGQNSAAMEVTRGFDIAGASDGQFSTQSRSSSRPDGHVEFTKLTASLGRRQNITESLAIDLSLSGQKSDERLLSAEEFYVGGAQLGRAFDSGEISGDDGAGGSVELQYGEFLSLPYLDSYQLYGFYDFGVVWETEATDFNGRATLSSAGGGIRMGITKSIFGGIEVAKPLTRAVANEGDKGPRVFFYLLISR